MTDKQIIIDGVDVSGCTHYDKNADKEAQFLHDCKKEHAPFWSCASMHNCLYKKYKRKEQECEELKFKSNYLQMVYNERTQECQELKYRLKNTGEEKDIHIKEKEYLYKEVEQLEQKLEKIKNYCEEQNLKADWTACEILKIIEE